MPSGMRIKVTRRPLPPPPPHIQKLLWQVKWVAGTPNQIEINHAFKEFMHHYKKLKPNDTREKLKEVIAMKENQLLFWLRKELNIPEPK